MSCCEPKHEHGRGHGSESDDCCDSHCCCEGEGHFHRRFMSPKEERELLESYRNELKLELEGLEARLKELERL
jgi:hypothetical protein